MTARQARSAKSAPPRPRGRPKGSVAARQTRTESPTTADILRKLNISVGNKEGKDVRQKLQAQHKASVKRAEEVLWEASRSNKLTMTEYRKYQRDRLTELVRRKAEIEVKILSRLKSLEEKYSSTSKEARAMLESRLDTLQ